MWDSLTPLDSEQHGEQHPQGERGVGTLAAE
jgi:hypothetical protein